VNRTGIFFKNAVILCLTSVLLRGAGVAFNAYISKRIGAEGMGLISLINSVYSFGVTFALSGINLAASRLTAEAVGRGENDRVRPIMLRCVLYGILFGTAGCIGLMSLSKFICSYLISDMRSLESIRILALGLPALSVTSALNGYFNAVRRVSKSASAQIFEMFFRISATVCMLTFFGSSVEVSCFYISMAVMLSEIVILIYSIIMYRMDISIHKIKSSSDTSGIASSLVRIALPVAFSSYIRSGLLTVEHLLIPYGLKRSGRSYERALSSYGILNGMALPAVLFPQAFLSAFSGLLIPETAEARVQGNFDRIRSIASKVFKITLWFSVGTAGIMLCFSYELGDLLYDSTEAGAYIRLLAPLIPIMYIDTSVDSILKGMNEQMHSMRINIADAFISVILVSLLIPQTGIKGYIITIYISEFLNTSLSIARFIRIADFRFRIFDWLMLPMLCVIGSCSITRLIIGVSGILFRFEFTEVFVCIAISAMIYIVMLLITGSVKHTDIRWMKNIAKRI